jgi:hypothetical protein
MPGCCADVRASDALDNRPRLASPFEAIKIEGDGKQSIPLDVNDVSRLDVARIGATVPDELPGFRSQPLNKDLSRSPSP